MNRNYRRLRFWATMPAIAALLMPADAHAIFGCLQRRYDAAAAQYGANVCTPQGQQLVCNYVPQTCYRAQMVSVPVTTYRPVTSCDPCTGCQTVCMRPQVCYQQQVKYTPYSTYRLQYSLQQPTCATTATTYYAPVAAATYAAPATGCSSCNSGATTTYYAPAVATPSPVTYGSNYAPAATYAPATSATPTYGGASSMRPAAGYAYPSTPAGIGGYNYAPSAFGAEMCIRDRFLLFAAIGWNTLVGWFVYKAIAESLEGKADYVLWFGLVPFLISGGYLAYLAARSVMVAGGIEPTLVEISTHPLYPGGRYDLVIVQSGRLKVQRFSVVLVCDEEATFRQGTNSRTHTQRVVEIEIFHREHFSIERNEPLLARIELRVPESAMHSFLSPHNAVKWKLLVRGALTKWPDFERAFSLLVYPGRNGGPYA